MRDQYILTTYLFKAGRIALYVFVKVFAAHRKYLIKRYYKIPPTYPLAGSWHTRYKRTRGLLRFRAAVNDFTFYKTEFFSDVIVEVIHVRVFNRCKASVFYSNG